MKKKCLEIFNNLTRGRISSEELRKGVFAQLWDLRTGWFVSLTLSIFSHYKELFAILTLQMGMVVAVTEKK